MIITPYYSFTRPADTSSYTSGDLVANSTTAASVVPLSWSIQGTGGSGIIRAVRFFKSSTTATAASFRVHLFVAAPPTPANGDNGAYGISTVTDHLDTVAVDLSSGAFAGTGLPWHTMGLGDLMVKLAFAVFLLASGLVSIAAWLLHTGEED